MAADVVVGGELALFGAHDQNAFAENIKDQEIAGMGDLRFTTGAKPFAEEYFSFSRAKNSGEV